MSFIFGLIGSICILLLIFASIFIYILDKNVFLDCDENGVWGFMEDTKMF